MYAGDEKHVVATQLHVRTPAAQDITEVYGHQFRREVLTFAEDLRTCREGILLETAGTLHQRPHRVHLIPQLVHPLAEDLAADLHPVGETVQHGACRDGVSVLHRPAAEIPFADIVDLVFPHPCRRRP